MKGANCSWCSASIIVLILMLQPERANSANILAIFPLSGRSHDNMYGTIVRALAEKGHTLTVITSQPLDSPPPNYKQIDFTELAEKHLSVFSAAIKGTGMLDILLKMKEMYEDICRKTLFHPEVKKLLNPSNDSEHFDLILTSSILSECFYGFAHIYKAPLVLLSPPGPVSTTYNSLGIVALPSCITNYLMGYTDYMTFPQRIINTVQTYGMYFYYYSFILSSVYSIMKEAYGENIPPFFEIEKNVSLTLVNHHFSLNSARPLVPNLIEIGGLHIKPPKELPKDLKEFMDGANKDGVIYVSLGSILKSMSFPVEVRDAFIGAFSQLKQRVLWKWEGDSPLPGQTKNVRLEKWLPQQDVLAHPNIKLFITHGGLFSMQEAANRGVPLIGIPFYGDQFTNLQRVTELQIGVKLDSKNITKENILNAINEVFGDSKYQTNMKAIKSLVEDQREHPLNTALYWIEYVMRHKGAKHMRLASMDLTWYQLYMFDVFFVLIVISIISLLIIYYVIVKLMKKICNSKRKTKISSKKNR